ncbi:UNVERIFIED_CONTAM: thiol:disulfide interchange protein DsbA/DsbL [Comamonas sp. A-3]|jgi:thiol:disulfide interchange protein DsbA|uniref:Thiol:disulfide interchange protein n=1 Tax=Comamonas thiooxydans TaxID=363952 RepID=A0AA42Q2F6_9BURK|nr:MULTISPECIES: thiol:disulfide interchange protein DsbA/DsbL [Comamonas]EFI59956.1 Twin-arginine translocation pathway signal [Comamonas thiooxydans]MBL5977172.1 thiol:disulfide interchange protein DsbA/DsbL [Comamonas sp. NyZ500]MDH1335679.1 thiol:disulfide interchange protein DsbA/DsbL [Comamonas thiooxydans]MDH1741819.1 thiol:disulfide interchange protein DsbA/DsbL [Comamonas thiooxydans]MDH1788388.1 thiol:disulfide interchange protein DsbA/DsbL [Comamonas thiooxydans]
MKRREFSLAASAAAAGALSLGASSSWAQGAAPKEGKDYIKLGKPASVSAPAGKVEVVEFFWYSCPHCNAFEPQFEAWAKSQPADVVVRRVPVAFNASFVPQQKLYYALEGMNLLPQLHAKVFRTIHVDRNLLKTDDAIFDWVGKQGVDLAKFKEVYNSFTVANQARKAAQLQNEYDVEGVPAMGVAGRYYTDGTKAGNMDNVLRVVNALVASSRKA